MKRKARKNHTDTGTQRGDLYAIKIKRWTLLQKEKKKKNMHTTTQRDPDANKTKSGA